MNLSYEIFIIRLNTKYWDYITFSPSGVVRNIFFY